MAYRWENVHTLVDIYRSEPMAAAMQRFLASRASAGVRFDIAHVHHLTGMSIDSLHALRSASVPTVLTLHDYWLFCPRGQMFHADEEACATATIERCTGCLARTFPWWIDAATGPAKDDRARQCPR